MITIDKLATGVPGLDTLTHGGIPTGRATLVVGKAGTGKTILGLQIIGTAVERGDRAVIVAVEESPEDLVTTASTLGLGIDAAVANGTLYMIDVTRPTEGPTMLSGSFDLAGLVHRLEAAVADTGATVVLIDSATALFSPKPPPDLVRALFFQLIGALRRLKVTAIILAESPADYGPMTTLGVEEFCATRSSCSAISSTSIAAAAPSRSTSTGAARTSRASTRARLPIAASPSFRSRCASGRNRSGLSGSRAACTGWTR